MRVVVYLMNGEAYEISLHENATIHDVKCSIPDTCPWQVCLFPYDLSAEDALAPLDDHHVVSENESFRCFMDTTDTRIFYFEKGGNPFDAMTNEEVLSRLSVYYLETGKTTSAKEIMPQTPQTEYYFDSESLAEWHTNPAMKDPLAVFLKMFFRCTYKGSIDLDAERNRIYRMKRK